MLSDSLYNITGDWFTDDQPTWSNNSREIYFISNRDDVLEVEYQDNYDSGYYAESKSDFSQMDIYKINIRTKNIDRITLMGLLEQAFRALLIKQYGSDENFDIVVNANKGDLQIFHNKLIVKDGKIEDENSEIELSEALKVENDFEVGEICAIEKKIEDFGRRAIQTLKQSLVSKVLEHDYDIIHKSYKDRINEIISGDVHHIRHREIILMDENDTELILPRDEQVPSDFFRKGDTVRAVVKEVLFNKGKPRIVISRTSPAFLERLFDILK